MSLQRGELTGGLTPSGFLPLPLPTSPLCALNDWPRAFYPHLTLPGPHPTSKTCTGWKTWLPRPRALRSKVPLHPGVFSFGCHPETTVTG